MEEQVHHIFIYKIAYYLHEPCMKKIVIILQFYDVFLRTECTFYFPCCAKKIFLTTLNGTLNKYCVLTI